MEFNKSINYLKEVYQNAGSVLTGKGKYTTINELTDQIPAVRSEVLDAAVSALCEIKSIPKEANVIMTEEDKGAVLAGLMSVKTGLKLAMARNNFPYQIPKNESVEFSMEYMDGTMTLNGLNKGDKVVVIDDTLATGGTLTALIKGIQKIGAEVIDVRVITEKIGYGGREKLQNELGFDITSVIGIVVDEKGNITVEEVPDVKAS